MNDLANTADVINLRDVIERVEELRLPPPGEGTVLYLPRRSCLFYVS